MTNAVFNAPSYPCPECGGRMDVKDSRPTMHAGRQTIRRRRRCNKCRFACTTIEMSAERAERRPTAHAIKAAREMRRAADNLIVALGGEDETYEQAAEWPPA